MNHELLPTPKSSPNNVLFRPSQQVSQFNKQKNDNAHFVQLDQFDYYHNNDYTMITSDTDQFSKGSKSEPLHESLDLNDLEDLINMDLKIFQDELIQSEIVQTEPIQYVPKLIEPVLTQPIHSESKQIEIAQTEPTQNEPVQTESFHLEIFQDEPILSELFQDESIQNYLVQTEPTRNDSFHSFKDGFNFSNLTNNQKPIIKLIRKNELINDSSLNDSNKIIDDSKSPAIELINDSEKQLNKDVLKEQKLINNSSLFNSISQSSQKNDKLENSCNILKNKVSLKQDSSNEKSKSLNDIKKSLKKSFFYFNDKFKNSTPVEQNQTEITANEDEKFCLDVDDEPKIMEDIRQMLTPDQSTSKSAENMFFSTVCFISILF